MKCHSSGKCLSFDLEIAENCWAWMLAISIGHLSIALKEEMSDTTRLTHSLQIKMDFPAASPTGLRRSVLKLIMMGSSVITMLTLADSTKLLANHKKGQEGGSVLS